MTSFGTVVSKNRSRLRLTQSELANKVKTSPSMVNLIEKDKRMPIIDDVPALARGLELEVRGLLLFWLKQQHPRTYPLIFGEERPSVIATEPEPGQTLFDLDDIAVERYRGLPADQRQTIGRVIDAFWEMGR